MSVTEQAKRIIEDVCNTIYKCIVCAFLSDDAALMILFSKQNTSKLVIIFMHRCMCKVK